MCTVTVYGMAELFSKEVPLQAAMRWQLFKHYIADPDEARRYIESGRIGMWG